MSLLKTTLVYHYIPELFFKAVLVFCTLIIVAGEVFAGKGTRRMIGALLVGCAYIALAVFVQVPRYLVIAATVILMFAARKIPFRRVAFFSAILLTVVLAIVILLSQTGFIQDYVLDDGYGRIRHYLGFGYALFPATVLMNITMLVVYVRKQYILWLEIIILFAANVGIFVLTGSRLSFALSVIVIVAGAFLKIWPDFLVKKKKIKYVLCLCFIVAALGSLFISYKYDPSSAVQVKLNNLLSDRLEHQKTAMDEYGFSIFGQEVEMNGNGLNADGEMVYDEETEDYFYIDNNYVAWYVQNGVIFFVIMIGLCTAMTIRSVRYDKRGYLLIVFVLMSLFCVIQDTFLLIHYNTFLLAAGNLLMNNRDEETIEQEAGMVRRAWTRHGLRFKRKISARTGIRSGVRWS